MVGGGRVIGAVVLAFVGATAAVLPAIAQQMRRPPTIIIYGDASRDWLADVKRFAALLDVRDKPVIVRGAAAKAIPDNATLVWFGDLAHDPAELKGVPEALRAIAEELGAGIPDRPVQLAPGEIRIGANCYTRHIDRADGLPEIAVNFSGKDPQGFCKGLTISHVLLAAGRWKRNEGTGCFIRDCAMTVSEGQK